MPVETVAAAEEALVQARLKLREADKRLGDLKKQYSKLVDQLGPAEFAFHEALKTYAAAKHNLEREVEANR